MTGTLEDALALHKAGQLDEAERRYREILRGDPAHAQTLNLLGVLHLQRGDPQTAVEFCQKAIAAKPDLLDAYRTLSEVLRFQGRLAEAEAAARKAVAVAPANPSAHFMLGQALSALGRLDDAAAAFREVLRLQPGNVDASVDLGDVLRGKLQYAEAIAACEAALRIDPGHVRARFVIGTARIENGDLEGAETAFQQVLELAPRHAEARNYLAHIHLVFGRYSDAVALYRQAMDEGIEPVTGARFLALALLYDPDAGAAAHYAEQRRTEERFARPLYPSARPHANVPDALRRVKVGYLSSDFVNHPVSRNIHPLLMHRDRARFEIYAYADVLKPDSATGLLEQLFDHWRPINGLNDGQVAEKIRADGIDILVILAGHLDRNRPLVAAHRPAPVQISFHDPATSGMSAIDYLIADPVLVPAEAAGKYFAERVVRLPSFYIHAPIADAPALTPLPADASGILTFGCFNSPVKVSDRVLETWAEILRRVPDSRLYLKYLGYYRSPALRRRVVRIFERHGIDPARLETGGARETMGSHLERYAQVDIALDPFPFTGSTTTFEAMWMGVPVVTLAGDAMAARWSASMLRPVGLGACVARTIEEYVEIAVRLAGNRQRLRDLRGSLRETVRGSVLCDGQRMARYFDRILQATWRRWCLRADTRPAGDRKRLGEVKALLAAGRADDARVAFEAASWRNDMPGLAQIYFDFGAAFSALRRDRDAAEWFARHLVMNPRHAEACFNLGLSLQNQGRLSDAIAEYRRALEIDPRMRAARQNLALLMIMLGNAGEAVNLYREGLTLEPGNADLLRFLVAATLYDPGWSEPARYAEARRFDTEIVQPLRGSWKPFANSREPARRLRIGYVTSDFREHPVGRNMELLLAHGDRDRFETIVYAEIDQPDALTERMKGYAALWRPTVGLSDAEVADRIRADGIDILVLLAGHLDRNRLSICARHPAPVQVSFHDIVTSGTSAVEYLIADRVVCPRRPHEGFSERVVRLPSIYAHPALSDAPEVSPLPVRRNGFVTFGSLNNPAKLSNVTFGLWAAVLQAVPGSRLRLKFRQWFNVPELRMRVATVFAALGIDIGRVDFAGADETTATHLDQYSQIDIALDPYPFAGSTTTFEALWMGVPVVTIAGLNMMSRWSASMLHALKLGELVADTPDRYVAIAAALANDIEGLEALRRTLRQRVQTSPLCNGVLRARQIERAYRAIWCRWCAQAS